MAGVGKMEDPARPCVPGAGRQPGRLPPAAGVRCRMCPSPTILSSTSPIRPNRAAAARSGPGRAGRSPRRQAAGQAVAHFTASEAAQQRIEQDPGRARRRRAHRDFGRAARRAAVRVHAAGGEGRGLSRAGRRRARRPPTSLGPAGSYRRLRAAARSAPERDPRRARSRRDRGQCPPRDDWEDCKAITEGVYEEARQTAGSAPTSS
jgi:hypothetical protein